MAVVRAGSGDEAPRIAEACTKSGVAAIALTYTVPGITEIIARLAEEYKGSTEFMIGAGTVLEEEMARTAILAGAQFVVSLYPRPETVKLCNRYRVPVTPGAMTIKEISEATEYGADIIKIFPGEDLGPKNH